MSTDNKKIAIATFHCAKNYGAFLQAFALQEWIKMRYGNKYSVLIVDYRPNFLIEPYKINIKRRVLAQKSLSGKIKALIISGVEFPYKVKKKTNFSTAQKKLSLTDPRYNDQDMLDDTYSALIVGSDQVWNTRLTQGVDHVFWGRIAPDSCRCISYAASVALSEYPDTQKDNIRYALSNMYCIGVREHQSVDILRPLCETEIEVNADPTMLVNPSFWYEYLRPIRKKDYILVYMVRPDDRMMQDAHSIAKRYNKKILHFGDPSIRPRFTDVPVKSLAYCGPFEFISYIANADLVLTDSFHATCFSIIFKRRFYDYLQLSRSERLRTLAATGCFEDRLLEHSIRLNEGQISALFDGPDPDYTEKFTISRKQSEDYLTNALEGIDYEPIKNN